MTTSTKLCAACGSPSEPTEWGFVLLATSNWTANGRDSRPGDTSWMCEPCSRASGRLRKPRILLVDDDALVLRATATVLGDFEVVTAPDGAEALRMLEQREFDAVISDVTMPHMDGAELFAAACERSPDLVGRFLFLSGDAEQASVRLQAEADRLGVVPPKLLQKPVPRQVLFDEVRRVCTAPAPSRSGTYSLGPVTQHAVASRRG